MPGKRWIKISARTLHILSFSGVAGAIWFEITSPMLLYFWGFTIFSGFMLMGIDIFSNKLWLIQIRGITIILKLLLLSLVGLFPDLDKALIAAIVILSAVVSHAPGTLRYYSVYHRRVIKSLADIKG